MLSVVLPSYHLADRIEANLRTVAESLRRAGIVPFELLPVDDGSGDGTPAALKRAADELGRDVVRPVILPDNCGKGEAFRAGFEASRGSHVMLLDADLDLDPAFAPAFFASLETHGSDIAIGSKRHPKSRIDYPATRRFASFVYYSIVRLLFHLPVTDTQTGMKLFRRMALRYAFDRSLSKRYAFDLELLVLARLGGFKVSEAPIGLDYNASNMGALTFSNVHDVLNDTAAIFYRLRILRYYQTLEAHPMPSPPPRVAVVIACPGNSQMLCECIAALERQRREFPSLSAIVLPDAPTGAPWPPWVRELPTGRALPSDKRNAGIAAAGDADVIAFLDDDARPLPGWLAHALPYFSDPNVGAVGGPAVTPPEDSFAARASGRVFASPLVSGAYRRRYVPRLVCSERDLPSCNLLVRADMLREIGGFDTAHWPGEDTLLCLEISRRKRLVYDPRVVAAHHRRPLFGPHLRQVSRYARHRGYFAKRFPETSRRPSYFAPSALLCGTIGAALCALAATAGIRAAALPAAIGGWTLALYAAAVLLVSHSRNLPEWIWTAAGTVATHFTYGFQFLRGLCAEGMPDGIRPFDHQGARKPNSTRS